MQKFRVVLKKAFTPVTIMLIPHSNSRSFNLKIPSVGIFISVLLWFIGTGYVLSVAVDALEYKRMKENLSYYSSQFIELKSTITSLKKAESELSRLFSFKTKEQVLKNIDDSDSGSLDMHNLKEQIKVSMESVGEIKDFLSQQKDLYMATPVGWPVEGHITSPYGDRVHPRSGEPDFHSGIDIASEPGNSVRATADGIVSFSGWSGGGGNLVVLEHGFGYSTYYAHNKMVVVRVGQKVKRGELVGYVGSTGNSTGPHLHYEVWREGKVLNPMKYIQGRS
ncbi:MAG: M23 family metallopeptidase [Nitrospirae bacterium]|nr:MAG: M23 family metallopeptidase [Nitrospirota bacterium]